MGSKWGRRSAAILLVVLVIGSGVAGMVAAQQEDAVTVEKVEQSYDGLETGSQAITLTYRLTAEQPISGFRVAVRPTEDAFVDYGSISTTEGQGVDVDAADAPGAYVAEEIEGGQSYEITFDAYPRRLDAEQLTVARLRLSAQNPQTYEDAAPVRADVSNNPYREYQNVKLFSGVGMAGFVAALVFGVVGLAVGGYGWFVLRKRASTDKVQAQIETLEDVKRDVDDAAARARIDEELDDLRGEGGTGPGTPPGPPGT